MKTTTITDEQIRDLIQEAAAAGDFAQVDLCHAALRGNRKARRACERAIQAASARRDAAMVDHTPLVIVGLRGGDSSEAKAAVCVDLDRGLVTNGEEWAALVRADRVHDLVEQTGATLVRGPETWDGSRFGDGNGGTVERVDGEVKGAGLYAPALA